jgi:hypothetical protein
MAAATKPFDAPERSGHSISLPLAADTTIYAGTLVALDSSGNARPAADTDGLRVIGRAEADANNSGGAAGAVQVTTKRGVFRFNNSTTAAIDPDDRGKIAYVEDDNTVAETTTHKVKAGRVIDIEGSYVWIDTTDAHLTTLADTVTGAADLAALKAALVPILQHGGLIK